MSNSFLDAQVCRLSAHLSLLVPANPFLGASARRAFGDVVEDRAGLAARLREAGDAVVDALRSPQADAAPLAAIAAWFRLAPFEVDLLLLALLPELDDRFGDVFAGLRGASALRRPTAGLAVRALVGDDGDRWEVGAWLQQSHLWQEGLLRAAETDGSVADRELVPAPALLAGLSRSTPRALSGGVTVRGMEEPTLIALALDTQPRFATEVARIVAWAEHLEGGVVVVPGRDRDAGLWLAACVAFRLDRPFLRVGPVPEARVEVLREMAALGCLTGAVIGVEVAGDPPRLAAPDPWRLPGLVFLACSPDTSVQLPSDLPARRLSPPVPRPAEQAAMWRKILDEVSAKAREDLLGNQTRVSPMAMRRVARLAADRAQADGRETAGEADVFAALGEVVGDPVSGLAEVRRPKVLLDQVLLPPRTRAQVDELLSRVQHRATVEDRWGMAGSAERGLGVIGLLHGESGTGKTLAVEAMAHAIGTPLVRVDLSRIVSKYIGETEKNLASIFDACEGFRALLFFDEADALFSRRTAVKDAHDRYANLETNYLLQRLEVFEGLALLASNLLQNLDDAFLRRIPFVIHFPRPSAALQRRLWQEHLPTAALAEDIDLDTLVARHDLVGGDIRNAARRAAYIAAAADRPVGQADLIAGVRTELVKKGRPVPEERR